MKHSRARRENQPKGNKTIHYVLFGGQLLSSTKVTLRWAPLFFFYFQSCTLRDLKTPKAEITAAGKGNAGNGTCEHWVHLYFCPLPANGSLGGIWLHTWDTSVATPSHEGLQFLVLVEHRKCLWSDALWFYLSLSPCLSHSVFTENRGDQSFKIHHSTEMGRRKHPPKTRSASPRGVKQQRCYKSAENLYLSPPPGNKMDPPDTKCYKYENISWGFIPFLHQFVPQELLMLVLPQVKGRTLDLALFSFMSFSCLPLCRPTQGGVKFWIIHFPPKQIFAASLFVKRRKISPLKVFLKFCTSLVLQYQV